MHLDEDLIRSLPKIELHNHIEGTITPETFHRLAKKNSSNAFSESIEACNKLYDFSDFQGFLNAFATVNQEIKEISDFDIIIRDFLSRAEQENYKYVEFFLSIDTFLKKGFALTEILEKLKSEFSRPNNKNMVGGIIIDFVRNYGYKNAELVLEEIKLVYDDYRDILLGISIGGDEKLYSAPPFKNLFEQARLLGLKTTAHAGEIMGPKSIWDTILNLKPDRIGHGINAIQSLDLIKHLKVTQTPLEICPTSNLKTKSIFPTLKNHPIRKLYDQGINISVNTDDSGFFGTDMTTELMLCANTFNFNIEEIKYIILETSKVSFISDLEKKYDLVNDIMNELDRI